MATDSPKTRWPLDHHLLVLDRDFDKYLEVFEDRRIFTGPSAYFYEQTVKLVRSAPTLLDLASSERLYELIYATLTSWGMHRMGESVAAKLTPFPEFRESVGALLRSAASLANHRIRSLGSRDEDGVTSQLAELVARRGISASDSPLVANAKTLHFLLPDLVPPIDRTYTGRFFYGLNIGMVLPAGATGVFRFIFPKLCDLARRHAEELESAMKSSYLCQGEAKVLDNAIVGYMLTHYPKGPRTPTRSVQPPSD